MTRKRVITERDVRRAKADGKSAIDAGDAVVTPSAREVAATLRIALGSAAAGARPAPPPRRGAPRPADGKKSAEKPSSPQSAAAAPAEARPPRAGQEGKAPASSAPSPAGPAATGARLTIAIGADHGGVALKAAIAKRLRELGHEVADVGTNSTEAVDYPDFAESVARMVGEGRAAFGIMIDGAGIGSCMAANKVARVRAAMCYDVTTAANAREHNFANVLTLGAGLIGERLAFAIVDTFLATPTGADRHAARVAKIDALDRRG